MSASTPTDSAAAPTPAERSAAELIAADQPALETKHPLLLTVAVMLVTITQLLDITIANVALPHMQSSLDASFDTVTWILTSYIIAGVLITPVVGWVTDRFGSRTVYIGSVVGFLIASMLCGMATSLFEMVLFRALQGVTAAFIGPIAQTILLDINRPSKQPAALSAWGLVVMIAPIMGPMLGGFLTDSLNWRWVFYINLPIGIPALAILVWLLPSRAIVKRKLDVFGFACLAVALGALQLMLDRGEHKDWFDSPEIVFELFVALSALWIFVVHTKMTDKPLFPRALFRDRNFAGSLGSMFVLGIANVAIASILPTMYQTVYGYTAFDTGLLLMPRALGILITMMIGTRLMTKIDIRYLVGTGYFVAGVAMWMMSQWSLEMGRWPILYTGFIQGLGLGCIFMPMNLISFSTLSPQYRPDGASIVNLVRNVGSSFGISIVVAMLARNTQISHADLATHITSFTLPSADPMAATERFGANSTAAIQMVDAEINRQALMIAYIDNYYAIAIFIMCIALSVFFLKPMRLSQPHKSPPMAE